MTIESDYTDPETPAALTVFPISALVKIVIPGLSRNPVSDAATTLDPGTRPG